jgi:hypothetical protein
MKRAFVHGFVLRLDGEPLGQPLKREWDVTSTLKPPLATAPPLEPVGSNGSINGSIDGSVQRRSSLPPNGLSNGSLNAAAVLDDADLSDFLTNCYPWDGAVLAAAEAEARLQAAADTDPTDTSTAASTALERVPPFFALGEVIIEARHTAACNGHPTAHQGVGGRSIRSGAAPNGIAICFGGKSFSGKSEQAAMVAERFKLRLFRVESLLSEALDLARAMAMGRTSEEAADAASRYAKELLAIGTAALKALNRGRAVNEEVRPTCSSVEHPQGSVERPQGSVKLPQGSVERPQGSVKGSS